MPISSDLKKAIESAENVVYIDVAGLATSRNDPSSPSYANADYLTMLEDLRLVRDVYGGTKRMRAAEDRYLPKGPHETAEEYDARLKRATLYPAMARTAEGLVGMIFRKDPILGGPEPLLEHADNIDMAGRDFPTFARNLATDAMVDGHTWGLVDYPVVRRGQLVSLADERAAGLRPYWVHLTKEQVHNWRYEMSAGRPVLTMLAYSTERLVPDGEFGEDTQEIIRVLRPGSWEEWLFVHDGGKPRWVQIATGATSVDYIPAVPLYTNRTGHFTSDPPLLSLAYENIRHWQARSDRDFTLKFAGSPMPVFTGTKLTGIEWGANRALFIEDPDAKAMLLEAKGTSLNEQRMELKDIEQRMASLGLQMLVRETRAAETAEAKLLDKAESDSILMAIARSVENALDTMWAMHADFANASGEVVVEMNRDYTNQTITPQMLLALLQMNEAGKLPLEEMWAVMQRGEILPEDFDFEWARENLEEPPPPPMLPGFTEED